MRYLRFAVFFLMAVLIVISCGEISNASNINPQELDNFKGIRSLREGLQRSKNIVKAASFDSYYTFIETKSTGGNFGNPKLASDFINICKALGGKMLVQHKVGEDSLTGQPIMKWVPPNIERNIDYFFVSKKDNGFFDLIKNKGTCFVDNKKLFTIVSSTTYTGGFALTSRALLLKSYTPQRPIFKNVAVSSGLLKGNHGKLEVWIAGDNPIEMSNNVWKLHSITTGFMHRCAKTGGRFVVLKEITPNKYKDFSQNWDAFVKEIYPEDKTTIASYFLKPVSYIPRTHEYVIVNDIAPISPYGSGTTILCCKLDNNHNRILRLVGRYNIVGDVDIHYVYDEDVDFSRLKIEGESVLKTPSLVRQRKVYNTPQPLSGNTEGSVQPNNTPLPLNQLSQAFAKVKTEIIAVKVSAAKENVIEKQGALTYYGIYNGRDGNCDLVSVIKKFRNHSDIYNYKICGSRIAESAKTGIITLPKDIWPTVKKIADQAYSYGSTRGESHGYTIIATRLNGIQEKNIVEVKIMKGIKLIEIKRYSY